MNYPNVTIQKGWECPKCGRVYSPITPMCLSCPQQTNITTGTSAGTSTAMWHNFIPSEDPNICSICGSFKHNHPSISTT